jgi:hypothetical protein
VADIRDKSQLCGLPCFSQVYRAGRPAGASTAEGGTCELDCSIAGDVLLPIFTARGRAGYVHQPERQSWTNFEAGVVLEATDRELVADTTAFFDRVWADAIPIDRRTVGVAIGEPTTTQFDVIMVRQSDAANTLSLNAKAAAYFAKSTRSERSTCRFRASSKRAAQRNRRATTASRCLTCARSSPASRKSRGS